MRRVSYQSVLDEATPGRAGVYVRLGDGSIRTKRKDARREVTVSLSKPQVGWLAEALALSGPDIDEGAVMRARVDLGRELELDWAVLASGRSLREAVCDAVMVRRRNAD